MKLTDKQIQTSQKEIRDLTNFILQEETWLTGKIAEEVDIKGAFFFESKEGEIDENVGVCYGFFVTLNIPSYFVCRNNQFRISSSL